MEAALSPVEDFAFAVADASHVGAARSAAQRMARALDFDEVREARVGIVVTEAVTNMLKHGGGGTFAARSLARGGAMGVELLAIDAGPGMESVDESSRDGVSTAGTQGTGLGAMRRQSDEFEVHSRPGEGTIVRMMLWNGPPPPFTDTHEVGAVCVPKPGETVCGDAWDVRFHKDGATFLVADGLGHGPDARRAAMTAVEVLRRTPDYPAIRLLDHAHGRLRPTRGAAIAVARHEVRSGELHYAGVGNIAGVVVEGAARQAMVSHSGIVGHNVHKSQEYRYRWPRGALVVLHSDGLDTRWDLGAHPGLADRHPAVIAAALFRGHSRTRDDCTVVVARALG
jgi:anti-sigma regulatory factor (Ser/Thr protein kinase)